jgi:hypothetical protein
LEGTAGADVLMGTRSNDVMNGGLGNDTLNGGEGTDTAIFSGNYASSTVTKTADGYTVQGPNGTDTLQGMERLKFDDEALALDIDGTAGQVYRLYELAFDRTPDKAGLGYWIAQMDAGVRLVDIADAFGGAREFAAAGMGTAQFVNYLYQATLHRPADTAGLLYWADVLYSGRATKAEVMTVFSESSENKADLASLIGQGIEYTPYG